ncbi:MAG: hypothetical protein AAFQ58_14435 [Pseudomonadota bacterium]
MRYTLGTNLSKLGDYMINGSSWNNPVYAEWMGTDISHRLHGIKDRVGDAINSRAAVNSFTRFEYDDPDDHEHCDACWARISKDGDSGRATSVYYSNHSSDDEYVAMLCPVCFSLFSAACQGILRIELNDPSALMPYQLKEKHWLEAVEMSKQEHNK